jgi:hypothetical protein
MTTVASRETMAMGMLNMQLASRALNQKKADT